MDAAWTLSDGSTPGTVQSEQDALPEALAVTAGASDLLLWLYGRVLVDTGPVPADLIERFRALCFTD